MQGYWLHFLYILYCSTYAYIRQRARLSWEYGAITMRLYCLCTFTKRYNNRPRNKVHCWADSCNNDTQQPIRDRCLPGVTDQMVTATCQQLFINSSTTDDYTTIVALNLQLIETHNWRFFSYFYRLTLGVHCLTIFVNRVSLMNLWFFVINYDN